MKRSRRWTLVVAAVLLLAVPVLAKSVEEETTSLGWLSENAGIVVAGELSSIGTFGARANQLEAEFRVLEILKGPDDLPGTVRVLWPRGEGPELAPGERAVLCLRLLPAEPAPAPAPARAQGTSYGIMGGSFGAAKLTVETERTLIEWVKEHLRATARDASPRALTEHLLAGLASKAPRAAYSAALDFVRLEESRGVLQEEGVEVVIGAFRGAPFGKSVKRALARALGSTQSEIAVVPLVEAILSGKARRLRADVGDALGRIGSEKAVKLLAQGLGKEDSGLRADVANTLGRLGLDAGTKAIAKALADPVSAVRVQAALAMGEVTRRVRKEEKRTIDALGALTRAFEGVTLAREAKAILWAVAQLDTQDGYDLLRKVVREGEDPELRRFAEATLANPRKRLVLTGN